MSGVNRDDETAKRRLHELMKHKPALTISRCPADVVAAFKNLATEEFCDDYGMALKDCLDRRYEYFELKSILIPLMRDVQMIKEKIEMEDIDSDKIVKFLDGSKKKKR